MANIIPLKDNTGAQFYPQTHEKAVVDSNGVNLQTKLASITTPTYVTAWDGASTPVVANIPAGVTVTYNTTSYTGTLAASASTANKTYLVSTGTTDNYNRYVTQLNGSTYSWQNIGSTEIDLSDYATKAELSQLDQKLYTPAELITTHTYELTEDTTASQEATVIPIDIKQGENFTAVLSGDVTKVTGINYLYACDSTGNNRIALIAAPAVNTSYVLTADADIKYLCIYVYHSLVAADTELVLTITQNREVGDIPRLSEDVAQLNGDIYVDKNVLPALAFDSIATKFSLNSGCMTSWPMALEYLNNNNSLSIDYLIFKPYPGDTYVDVYKMTVEANVAVAGDPVRRITLKDEWLVPSLGTGVYKIPFKGVYDYIPAFRRFYVNTSTGGNGYLGSGQSTTNNPDAGKSIAIGYGREVPFWTSSDLRGKKIGFLGDSLTAGGQYLSAFQALSGCNAVNYGVAATHIAATGTSYDETYPPFEERVSDLANDLDGIVVFGGTNDFGHTNTAPFGTFDDYTDVDILSFYAGCHRTFKQLYDKYRGKPIVIMTPIHHGYEVDAHEYNFEADGTISAGTNPTTGKTFKEYVDAIKQVAAYYSFAVIDAYSESGLNPCLETSNARYYFSDGLHLSQNGGNRLGKYMLPLMEAIFKGF